MRIDRECLKEEKMREWIIENAELVCLLSSAVLALVNIVVLSVMIGLSVKFKRLRKKLILVDAAMGRTYNQIYSSLDLSEIKDGTRDEVLNQMKSILIEKLNEGTFTFSVV